MRMDSRGGALPRLEGLILCEVGWAFKSHLCLSLRGRRVAMQEMLQKVQHQLAGRRSTRLSSLSAVPRAHQGRDKTVHDLCSRRTSPPRANQEAAVDAWIRGHQVVVIAWSSLLRARQCVCAARVCSCWHIACMPWTDPAVANG